MKAQGKTIALAGDGKYDSPGILKNQLLTETHCFVFLYSLYICLLLVLFEFVSQ